MKKFILQLGILFLGISAYAQQSSSCVTPEPPIEQLPFAAKSSNCARTSAYWNDDSLYVPDPNQDVIYIKANFIFLTKPDGTGNFEQNNPEHLAVINDIIDRANWSLLNLIDPVGSTCNTESIFRSSTKLQLVVNKVWRVDPAWDLLQTGYDPAVNNRSMLFPWLNSYYYSYFDTDQTLPPGIDVVFSNNGDIYQDMVVDQNYANHISDGALQRWAGSQYPTTSDLDRASRQYYPDVFNRYIWFKHVLTTYQNVPWATARNWFIGTYGFNFLPHEFGHSFFLGHENSCNINIMTNMWPANPRYLKPTSQIGRMYRYMSTANVRNFMTEDSFTNTDINISGTENWDLDFRLYSNVLVDNSSELNLTCNLILPPQSRIIAKNGSVVKIDGGDVNSADEATWNGIKIQDNSSLEILPGTEIDNGYFYAYTDNTANRRLNTQPVVSALLDDPMLFYEIEKEYKKMIMYPNPTSDGFITIDLKDEKKFIGSDVRIMDESGKILIQQTVKENTVRINIEKLKKGIYYILLNSESKILVKEH